VRHLSFDFISAASLYRGILPPIMVEAPKRATKFAANEQYTGLYKKLFGFEKVTQSLSIMTGVSAGITEAFLIVPFELIKVRMQDKRNVSFFFMGILNRDLYIII
jgi:solute carrier family 25 2-oxodicarboxylate transporter 21